jgi:hypothetical protein
MRAGVSYVKIRGWPNPSRFLPTGQKNIKIFPTIPPVACPGRSGSQISMKSMGINIAAVLSLAASFLFAGIPVSKAQ